MWALRDVFYCGPLAVILTTEEDDLRERFVKFLKIYDVVWNDPHLQVRIDIHRTDKPAETVTGNYLNCARMNVDSTETGLNATTISGASVSYLREQERWLVSVPRGIIEWRTLNDVEDLVVLALTNGWRKTGWIPIHSGAVAKPSCCALLAAPSGSGKTTLVTAMIRREWQTLGDDKLLLRIDSEGLPEVAALAHNLNLDPQTKKWFPEVGNIEAMPTYSVGPKRRVAINDFWPEKAVSRGRPTHLVRIILRNDLNVMKTSSINSNELFSTLLHQTVIPKDKKTTRQIMSVMSAASGCLKGLQLEIGKDVYYDGDCLAPLEEALQH